MRNQILSGSPPLPVQNICQDIKVCLCWQQQVWWLPYQVERWHCRDAEMRETEDNQTGGSTPVWAGSVGECWAARGRKMNGALSSERGNSVLIRMSNPLPALSRNHFDRMVVISDLYLSYPWLLQSDPWAEWCSHHHHNIHWTDRTWLQYQPDKFQLTGPRWRSWTLLDWRRLISVTWRSWTIRMRKSVGTTTTSLYTSRVLHLGDIIVVNTNVCFHSFVVNKYIFYC